MKLLILTCLVAVALARPKLPHRHPEIIQNEQDSREKVLKERKFPSFALEYINELNRQRELLKEKQKDEHKEYLIEDPEQQESSSTSSSEEVVPINTEQKRIPREDMLYQHTLEALRRLSKYNQLQLQAIYAQEQLLRMKENSQRKPMRVVNQEQAYFYLEPFQPSYQLDVYPYAAWFHPAQIMQHVAYSPFHDTAKLIASENSEKTDIIPEW
uniref:Alpha-S1-casein n=1 Tax=Equus asinus africanus TaxID=582580 RepID=C3W972_EQUAS|nr:alpha s1 casein precursor [Equus asinus africanus]